jgi:hypothetical protein
MEIDKKHEVISGNKYFNFYTILIILADVLLVYKLGDKLTTIIISVIILDVFAFIVLYGLFYSFCYNREEIIVKHLWSNRKKIYKINELTKIELKSVPTFGKVVVLHTSSGKKRGFGAGIIKLELLNKMIHDIQQYISSR